MHEDVEVLEDGNQDAEHQREPGSVEAEGCRVRHHVLLDTLGAPRAHEVDVRHQDGDPREQAEDGDQVNEVTEDYAGVVCHVQESDAAD